MNLKPIPIGIDNFEDIRKENYYYVDKTKSIEELLQKGSEVVLYPRPRRFGKSLFISTLEHFFDIEKKEENKDLFEGLYISKSECFKEFGKYPVIHLDFKDLKQDNFSLSYEHFQILMAEIYYQKKYLLEILDEADQNYYEKIRNKTGSVSDYQNSIKQLSIWLERYYQKKVIILIDKYDVLIQGGYVKGYYEEIISFMKSVFSSALKGNDSLKLGVMTGVLRVSKESLFSDLNNLTIYDMMNENYNEAFGFNEKETKELLEYYGLEFTKEVKEYYDGYNFGGVSIFNPWSILNYAERKKLDYYWVNTSSNALISKLLSEINFEDKIKIEKLLTGESISFTYDNRVTYQDFDDSKDINKVLNLFFMSGFLTYEKEESDELLGIKYQLFQIPNKEVKEEIKRMIERVTFQKEISNNEIYEFMKNVISNEKEKVEKYINKLLPNISYYDTKENFYHGYMIGLFSGFLNERFIVKSNREAGIGRFDLSIESIDKKIGIIIEFKVAESENEMENLAIKAKEQMKEKEYYKELELDKIKRIL